MAEDALNPQTTTAEPAPTADPSSYDGLMAALDAQIAEATEAANAEAATEEQNQPAEPAPQEPAAPEGEPREPSDEDQAADTEADAPDEGTPDPSDTSPPRYSRRDAARFAEQVKTLSTELETTRQQLAERQRIDSESATRFVSLIKTNPEFEALRQRAENGDWQAKDELDTARQWRQMAAPIFAHAQQLAEREAAAMRESIVKDFKELVTLEGVDESTHAAIKQAATPVEAMRRLYDVGIKVGQERHKEEKATLEAQVADLKTKLAARGIQPAGRNGQSAHTGLLAGAIGADGLITDDFLRRAENGEFVGVDTSAAG